MFVKSCQPLICLLTIAVLISCKTPSKTTAATPAATQPARTIRLLTVGNSFSQNATKFLPALAKARGHEVIIGRADFGGCSLQQHWKSVEAWKKDSSSPEAKFYPQGKGEPKVSLHDMLKRDRWDFITIQQASHFSDDEKTYHPYAENLVAFIKEHAPQAEVIVHQTWAYRQDHPKFKNGASNPEKMHNAARAAYHAIAMELGLRIVPVGDAMWAAGHSAEWPYQPDTAFDPKTAVDPVGSQEKNALHLGWVWGAKPTGERFLRFDAFHANVRGCYLGSCVFYEFLFGESAVGNPFVPKEIMPEDALFLQTTSHNAMKQSRKGASRPLPQVFRYHGALARAS